MSDDNRFETRLAELGQQVESLTKRVVRLERACGQKAAATLPPETTSPPKSAGEPATESSILIDSSSLLKLISIECFLLVAALALRELTGSNLLNQQIGSILGLLYATGLIVGGDYFYRKANSLAPFFALTGAGVMFSVLVESHARFSTMPEEVAYLLLAITGIGMAMISYRHRVALPIIVGTLGMSFSAMAIGFPTPDYPYLGLMLWASNILGFFATRLKRCSWLRWLLLLTTHFMLQVWGLKISGVILGGQERAAYLSPGLYMPIVTLIGFTFMMIALFGIIRSGNEKVSKFDFSVPAVNAGWWYVAGIYALKNPPAFGAPAAAAAVIHFGLAYWLARRQKSHAQGTNTFVTGGIILSCLSLPALFNSMFLPLPILAVLAFATTYFSNDWSSGGMRVSSYLLQFYVCSVFALEFISGDILKEHSPLLLLIIALICSITALAHYRFSRFVPPPVNSQIFRHYDKQDMSGLLPLSSGLISAFLFCMIIAQTWMQHSYPGNLDLAMTGMQSLVINLAAIVIMLLAVFRHNTELRNIAILILLIGGAKVFVLDLFKISGPWLVTGIFSFGIAAALASLILARWKSPPGEKE